MDKDIWEKWNKEWNWILNIAIKRNWKYEPLKLITPIDIITISKTEEQFQIKFPNDFKEVLTNYASGVKFGWQIEENKHPVGEFNDLFCGCGGVTKYRKNAYLWDFNNFPELYRTYEGWKTDCYDDPTDSYGKHYYDKIPLMDVPNGDLIVFDKFGQVIYLSHDDGPLHGERLAENFIEFITLWSNLGCVGTESEQFSVFYDEEKQKIMNTEMKIERWKKWLQSNTSQNIV
jgi:hypothetical protein